jgi:small subunit ribosomal protein S4
MQLEEKQKVRYSYGIQERQFRSYVKTATEQNKDRPVNALYQDLESRLDNVVFRSGFAKSRQMARQLVVHGHIFVNGRRIDVPSYTVKAGDDVMVRQQSQSKGPFIEAKEGFEGYSAPSWLSVDRDKLSTSIQAVPTFDPTVEIFDLTSVIEFYSR